MKHFLLPICTLAVALVGAGSAMATPVTQAGLTVISGGLTFSNFTCAFSGQGTFTGACDSISVTALTPQPAGIQFSSDMAVIGGPSGADAALTFNVNSTTGINAVGLSFNSTFLGLDVNSVTEDVYSAQGGSLVGTATVSCGAISGCSSTTTDDIALSGMYNSLYITKDISLIAGSGGYGSTSIVQQTFTGAVAATPEPISLSLMGAGLAFIGLARARKSKV
jgi:hypothetical protein